MIKKFFIVCTVCLLIAACLKPFLHSPSQLDIWMLNVGQGESVLVREPSGKKLLFDGGPTDVVLSQLGAVLLPWDRTIDLVILSHNHSDHLRGIISVLERYSVKEVWISGALMKNEEYHLFVQLMERKHLPPRLSYFNTTCFTTCPPKVAFGKTFLQVYHPLYDMSGTSPPDQHDATVMVKVSYLDQSLLLTGDLNEQHEAAILQACHPTVCSLASTVLQEPHHGSATGLLPAFLAAIQPRAILIPVGLANKFNHPAPSIIARLKAAHLPVYRTDTQGRIHLTFKNNRTWVKVEGK